MGRLTNKELVGLVRDILDPGGRGVSSKEVEERLDLFCMNCSDPAGAANLIIEAGGPTTAEGIVDAALGLAPRDPRQLPEELPREHPLRHMKWEWKQT